MFADGRIAQGKYRNKPLFSSTKKNFLFRNFLLLFIFILLFLLLNNHPTIMAFSNFSKVESIKELNTLLGEKSYVDGYVSFVAI
jgi:hypothetical protein